MRISDWSSDVCSSDLDRDVAAIALVERAERLAEVGEHLDDIILVVSDRRSRRIGQVRRIVEIADIGIDRRPELGGAAALLFARRLIGHQADRQLAGGFATQLAAKGKERKSGQKG